MKIRRDYYSGLTGGADWAVYVTAQDEQPIAVFAKRPDALAFKRLKEAE